MKKVLFFAALATVLAGCSSDEFLQEPNMQNGVDGAIMFGPKKTNAHYAPATHGGVDAAALLGSNFLVEGVKTTKTSSVVEVFDHYNVNYVGNPHSTESNTKGWEYVGVGKHHLSEITGLQTIKYWDYSTTQYDFVAFSYGKSNWENADLTEIKYGNLGNPVTGDAVYTVTGTAEELAKCYIADLVTLYNRDGVSEYKDVTVTPNFRSLGTKVRVAFYETVPGYSVSNVKFYNEAWNGTTATSAAGAANATLFTANAFFPGETTKGTMSVYYPTVGWTKSGKNGSAKNADYNQAHVKFAAGTEAGEALVTTKTFGTLDYNGGKELAEKTGTDFLGRTSKQATYAGNSENDYYEIVLPLGEKENLQLRIEYDLVPIDGAAEVIHVRDARAVVPAAYAEWQPNYAYTYIFKISDNTNGWTGVDGDGKVVEGLTPITFDAVVVDSQDGNQETITSVSTHSITTYQKGVVVTANDEYKAGDVYAAVMNGTSNVTLTTGSVAVYTATTTNAIEGITEATVLSKLSGNPNKITLEPCGFTIVDNIPTADGNTAAVSAAKFTVAEGKVYVFMYTDGSKNYVKVIKTVGWDTPEGGEVNSTDMPGETTNGGPDGPPDDDEDE